MLCCNMKHRYAWNSPHPSFREYFFIVTAIASPWKIHFIGSAHRHWVSYQWNNSSETAAAGSLLLSPPSSDTDAPACQYWSHRLADTSRCCMIAARLLQLSAGSSVGNYTLHSLQHIYSWDTTDMISAENGQPDWDCSERTVERLSISLSIWNDKLFTNKQIKSLQVFLSYNSLENDFCGYN